MTEDGVKSTDLPKKQKRVKKQKIATEAEAEDEEWNYQAQK